VSVRAAEPERGVPVFAFGSAIAPVEIRCTVIYGVGTLRRADAVAVEAFARLQLTARRRGRRMSLHGQSAELRRYSR
jgi:hypothetical protein